MYATLSVTLCSLEVVSEKSCMHSGHIGGVTYILGGVVDAKKIRSKGQPSSLIQTEWNLLLILFIGICNEGR